jgi:hypothetical protein
VFLDSDGQYNPIQIELLINSLDKEIVVCGVRSPRNDSFIRKFYSSCFGLVFRILFRLNLKDPSSPFIAAYKKDLDFLSFVDLKLSFGFWWEFQARISNKGFKVIEIPAQDIDSVNVSSSKIRKAIVQGDLSTANHYLNEKYSLKN